MKLAALSVEERYEIAQPSRTRDDYDRPVYCVNGCGDRYAIASPPPFFDFGAPLLVRCTYHGHVVDPTRVSIANTLDPATLRAILVAFEPVRPPA